MESGRVIILTGKSAVGKDSIAKEVGQRMAGLKTAISTTSRPRRTGEIDGVDYHFITLKEFGEKEKMGQFWDTSYYTPIVDNVPTRHGWGFDKSLYPFCSAEKDTYLITCDYDRAITLREKLPCKVIIVLITANEEKRRERAKSRDLNYVEAEWQRRAFLEEKKYANAKTTCDYLIENDIFEKAVLAVMNIINWDK